MFDIVSQGVLLFKTDDLEQAQSFAKQSNDAYNNYLQECRDNFEVAADNAVFVYDSDGNDVTV